jgi:hypothetical protein
MEANQKRNTFSNNGEIVMKKLSLSIKKCTAIMLAAALIAPAMAIAADTDHYELTNQSKQAGAAGYYLTFDAQWPQGDSCVSYKTSTDKKIMPGETVSFDMKKTCNWGGVKYKVFSLDGKENIGFLSQAVRNGVASLEITASCAGKSCSFNSLNPTENKKQ